MTDRLEERLDALRGELPRGDWLDVRHRVRRRRTRRAAVIAVAAVLGAIALVPLGVAGRIVDFLTVEKTQEEVPRPAAAMPPYVFGDRVYRAGKELRLAQTLAAPFLGPYERLAITSAAGDGLVYHAWGSRLRGPGPALLRRYDFSTGDDEVLVRGAQSFAWRRDGAVAYMRSARPRYVPTPRGIPPVEVGQVEVRPSPNGASRRWTHTLTRYIVRAWAGQTLLVEVRPALTLPDTQPQAGVYTLNGPGRMRRLPLTDLIAVSPDGRRVVGLWRPSDSPSRTMRLVDVATGRSLAQTEVPVGITGPGDWRGETVVAVSSFARRSVLILLRAAGDDLTVSDRLRLDERAGLQAYYGGHFHLPLFVGPNEVVVGVTSVGRDEHDSKVRFLTCDLGNRRCRSGRALEPLTRWAAVLTNPSRP
jgi:hypothetical protein